MTELASNGTSLDHITDEDWETPHSLKRFDTVATEKLHLWSLGSHHDDECGNAVDWHWWAARFNEGRAILVTDSQGSSFAERYKTDAELSKAWEAREDEYAAYVHAECAEGTHCPGCVSCENA